MVKRTEKVKLQTDLQKLQSYRSNLESFKANLENKASGLAEELEASGKKNHDQTLLLSWFSWSCGIDAAFLDTFLFLKCLHMWSTAL